jgi:hypothetical protein
MTNPNQKNRPVKTNFTGLSLCQLFKRTYLPIGAHFAKAIGTINGPAFSGLERYFRILAAFGADSGVHLARFYAGGAAAFSFPCLTAGRATLGFIGVTLGLEELLFSRGESELGPAIGTCKLFVLKSHG